MSDLWMPGAQHLDIGDHAATEGGPAKAVAHITWDKNATASKPADLVPYSDLVDYFGRNTTGRGVAPHLLWDPFTGRFTQFVPATSRSKSLVDQPGGTRTNRAGRVVIQIEALFFPYCRVDGIVHAELTDTPCKGWGSLNSWVRSWGVPDTWPMGRPTDFRSHRDERTWEREAGWYGHSQVPENDHQDPGSWPEFRPAIPSQYEPYPGASYFRPGRHSAVVTAMGRRLVAEGCDRYTSGPGPDWTEADRKSYAAWQRKLGYSDDDADGIPGPASWERLKVPNV
ncbi:peptidoglycan-binding protein [Streptomyces sp. NBC_00344]|uniref:peptidoglycan-binding protein n=1 Tax=Streptomyces sp. NBC_00344 TaxID=2975720 RepID=UPI002E1B4B77